MSNKNMSTYAPVYNPAAKSKLLIFSVSENQHLNLRNFDTKSGKTSPEKATDTSSLKTGFISVPCTLAGLEFEDWTRIYGWVDIPDQDDKDNTQKYLYMLSPVHAAVTDDTGAGVKSTYTGLAGLIDRKENSTGYLYYLDGEESLWEQSLSSGGPTAVADTVKIKKGTAISAYYGPEEVRYMAFQAGDKNGSLQVWNATQRKLLTAPNNANPADKTPIALCQFKNKTGNLTLNLYYVRKTDGVLMRSQSSNGGDKWDETPLVNAGKPSTSTTLSATWDEDSSSVFVTYSLGKDVTCIKDKW